MDTKKRKRGRPPVDSERICARIERLELNALDKFVAEQADLPARPEALRRILKDWLIGHGYLDMKS